MDTNLLEKDVFQFTIPIEKSMEQEDGSVIIEGVGSAPEEDHQGEFLDPHGFDLSYFLKAGWVKWEHKGPGGGPALPNQFIGEPIEARITPEGQFYFKAKLDPHSPVTHQVKEKLVSLEKSHSSRRMGVSIEGQATERDPLKPTKVLKAIIRNIVLTMNPVNGGTWATLAKSLTSPEALSVDLDTEFSLEKALSVGDAAAVIPQHIEGYTPEEEDETEKAIRVLRSFVHRALDTEIRKSLLETSSTSIVQGAYDHAVEAGMSHADALDFASLVYERRNVLKSVLENAEQGGASMSKVREVLGETMDELQKSLTPAAPEPTEEQELDNLLKSIGAEEENHVPPAAGGEEEDPEEEEEEGSKGETHKSITDSVDLTKSFSGESVQALDVSPFLSDLAKSLGDHIGEVKDAQDDLIKSMAVIGKALKASLEREAALTDLVKSLQGQVEQLGAKPVGRRSVVSATEVPTVPRSVPAGTGQSRQKTMDLLIKSHEEGLIPISVISSFEQGFPLTPGVEKIIGLNSK